MPQYKFQYLTESPKGTRFWLKLYIWGHDVDDAKEEADERLRVQKIKVHSALDPEEV